MVRVMTRGRMALREFRSRLREISGPEPNAISPFGVVKYVLRIMPSLAAVAGSIIVLTVLFFPMPPEKTALAALVPMLSLFIVNRIMIALVPVRKKIYMPDEESLAPPTWQVRVGLAIMIAATLGAVVALVCSLLYLRLDEAFPKAVRISLAIASMLGGTALAGFVVCLGGLLWKPIKELWIFSTRQILGWVFFLPTRVADVGTNSVIPTLRMTDVQEPRSK